MEKPVPVVRLTLGDSLPEIRRKSTHPLPLNRQLLELTDLLAVTEPVSLEYIRDGRSLRLPPGKFLSLTFSRSQVTTVTASPHLESLPLERGLALAAELVASVDRAGWPRASNEVTVTPERIRRELEDPTMPERYRANVAVWRDGDDEIVIQVQRHRTATEARQNARILGRDTMNVADGFIVSFEAYNGALVDSLFAPPPERGGQQ